MAEMIYRTLIDHRITNKHNLILSSVQFSHSVMSDSL